jgi:hypothetical protein
MLLTALPIKLVKGTTHSKRSSLQNTKYETRYSCSLYILLSCTLFINCKRGDTCQHRLVIYNDDDIPET